MVATTLAPTLGFRNRGGSGSAERCTGEPGCGSRNQRCGRAGSCKALRQGISVCSKGDPAKPLKAEASASDGGTLTYQWQSSKDGKNFTDIKDATNAEYTPQTGEAGTVYYRVLVTNTAGGSASSAAGETITVTVAENAVATQAAEDQHGRTVWKRYGSRSISDRERRSAHVVCRKGQWQHEKEYIQFVCKTDVGYRPSTGKDWTPIGQATNTYSDYVAYGGTFDGGGHMVSGLAYQQCQDVSGAIWLCKRRNDTGSDG